MRPPGKGAGPAASWYYDQYQTVIKKAQGAERARLANEAAREAAEIVRKEQERIRAADLAAKEAERTRAAELEEREKALAKERAAFEREKTAEEVKRREAREEFEKHRKGLPTLRELVEGSLGIEWKDARTLCNEYLAFIREKEDRAFDKRNPEDRGEASMIAKLTGETDRAVYTMMMSPQPQGIAA